MTDKIEFDTKESGLRAVLKDYQEIAMRAVWESSTGLSSKQDWDKTNERLNGGTISRASIINFLEAMREMGVLKGIEITGKGGHRWIYSPAMNEAEFKTFIADTLLRNLLRDFPEETRRALFKMKN